MSIDSRAKVASDRKKRLREKESHLRRISSLARKNTVVTIYQEMAMKILEENWIPYVKEKPILNRKSFYLIDIYLPEYKMCVEIDWATHDEPEIKKADRIRDEFLKKSGYWVFRIKNHEVHPCFLYKIKGSIKAWKEWQEKKKQ